MEASRFDQLARALGTAQSRRGFLGHVAAAAAAVGLLPGTSRAAAGKQAICHVTGDPAKPYVVIEVADPAWPEHQAHGDIPYVNCCVDADCGATGACCNGACVDITSPCNCGGCGTVCPEVCSDFDATVSQWTGVYQCQPVVPCPNHCSGHGICDFSNGQCSCTRGYAGFDCSYQMSCFNGGLFCNGHGICDVSQGVCQCDVGFGGDFCYDQLACEAVTCGDATSFCHCGACGNVCAPNEFCGDVGDGTYTCQPVVACPNECNGNGACNQHTGECICYDGFTGPDCTDTVPEYYPPCFNGGFYCNGHGLCVGNPGVCQCDPGYGDYFCEQRICA